MHLYVLKRQEPPQKPSFLITFLNLDIDLLDLTN